MDWLIPQFALEPRALAYSPIETFQPTETAFDLGKLHYYEKLVEVLLKHDPDRLQQAHDEASAAGVELSERLYPRGPFPPDHQQWWYVPILPGLSAEDVRRSDHHIEEIAREIGGETPIDDLILDLKKRGTSHRAIANMLGISVDTVKRAVRTDQREGA